MRGGIFLFWNTMEPLLLFLIVNDLRKCSRYNADWQYWQQNYIYYMKSIHKPTHKENTAEC